MASGILGQRCSKLCYHGRSVHKFYNLLNVASVCGDMDPAIHASGKWQQWRGCRQEAIEGNVQNLTKPRATALSGLVIRRATMKDYQSVMAIGTMYNGMDYLPYFYKHFIGDPQSICFVCEFEREIVGLKCMLLQDGGTVAQGRAGRMKESCRGKGYFKAMSQHIETYLAEHTSAKSLISVRDRFDINWATINPEWKHIDSGVLYEFPIKRSDSQIIPPNIKRMYKDDIQTLFENQTACHHLFPCGLIYVGYLPLGLDKVNMKHIINDNTVVYGTTSLFDATNVQCLPQVSEQDSYCLITVGFFYPIPGGYLYSISIFGTELDTLDSHIHAHMNQIPFSNDRLFLAVYTSETFSADVVKQIVSKYGINDMEEMHITPLCTIRKKLIAPSD